MRNSSPGKPATFPRSRGGVDEFIEGEAERLPFADGSFDLVVSEYGASVWCDPERWVAEAAR